MSLVPKPPATSLPTVPRQGTLRPCTLVRTSAPIAGRLAYPHSQSFRAAECVPRSSRSDAMPRQPSLPASPPTADLRVPYLSPKWSATRHALASDSAAVLWYALRSPARATTQPPTSPTPTPSQAPNWPAPTFGSVDPTLVAEPVLSVDCPSPRWRRAPASQLSLPAATPHLPSFGYTLGATGKLVPGKIMPWHKPTHRQQRRSSGERQCQRNLQRPGPRRHHTHDPRQSCRTQS